MDEVSLVGWIGKQAKTRDPRDLILGIGDDCAILRPRPGEDLLLKTDPLIEGIHFTPDLQGDVVGARALARSLSDIAAMGGDPRYCLLSLTVGPRHDERWIKAFIRGFLNVARRTGTILAGGDLAHSERETHSDVMLVGACPAGTALRRDGARPGDVLYVSGPLGKPWILPIRPRLSFGRKLRGAATACMDLSDGLSLDLMRLAKASGVSARLDHVPVYKGSNLDRALNGGEDYELLFAMAPDAALRGSIRIGTVTRGRPGHVFLNGHRISSSGYQHFR